MSTNNITSKYYTSFGEVKPIFEKEYISLWPGWLGPENSHKLDEVDEREWSKFNVFLKFVFSQYKIMNVRLCNNACEELKCIEDILPSYKEDMKRESSEFTRIIIPELKCVLEESWDYTYVLWHKDNGAVESLTPLIEKSGLLHFS